MNDNDIKEWFDSMIETISNLGAHFGDLEGEPFIVFPDWNVIHVMYTWIVAGSETQDLYLKALVSDTDPDIFHDTRMVRDLRLSRNGLFPSQDRDGFYFCVPDKVQDFLNQIEDLYGIDLEDDFGFEDEYTMCSNCGGIIRTSPDCYAWKPDYLLTDGEILCSSCWRDDDVAAHIMDSIRDGNTAAFPQGFDTSTWTEVGSRYENGLHGGQTDNPLKQGKVVIEYNKKIAAVLNTRYQDFIQVGFEIYPSQFYVEWTTYIRFNPDFIDDLEPWNIDEIASILEEDFKTCKDKYDRARLLERALKSAPYSKTNIDIDTETGEIHYTELDI